MTIPTPGQNGMRFSVDFKSGHADSFGTHTGTTGSGFSNGSVPEINAIAIQFNLANIVAGRIAVLGYK